MAEWYEEGQPRKRSKWPLLVAAVVLFAGVGVGGWLLSRAQKPKSTAPVVIVAIDEPATLEPFVLAERTPALDDVFGTRMMDFVIGLDHGDSGEPALHLPEVAQALGPRSSGALNELLAATKRVQIASNDDDDAITNLEVATARMDNALLGSKLPYFVDTNVIANPQRGTKIVLMYEFTVGAMGLFESEVGKVRSVRLRRIDKLNWEHTLLGFVNPHRIYAVVLLDQIDELLVRHLLPGLAHDSSLSLIAFDETPSTASRAIAARGGELAREEMSTVVAKDDALALGEALRARRELFDKWRNVMHIAVRPPSKLSMDLAAFEKDLANDLSRDELRALRDVQHRLDVASVVTTYERLRDAFADSIERHEAQHRLDVMRPIPVPAPIDDIIPPQPNKSAERMRMRMQAELSAYLSQVGRDEKMARTTYTLLLRFLVDPRTRGTAEATAAMITTEVLAKELGIKDVVALVENGHLDEDRVVRAHAEICRASSADVAAAARKAWTRMFEVPFPSLRRL